MTCAGEAIRSRKEEKKITYLYLSKNQRKELYLYSAVRYETLCINIHKNQNVLSAEQKVVNNIIYMVQLLDSYQ